MQVIIWPGYRLTLSLGRPRAAPAWRRVWLAAAAATAIGVVAVPAIPASASGNPDPANLSVSVSVVPPVVTSVTLSVGSTSYTNCTYGSSTSTQLGFPNGACQAVGSPITVTNGTAPATITVNGADMVPADNGTHWTLTGGVTLAGTTTTSCGAPLGPQPGPDQYCETTSIAAGYNSGAQFIQQPFLGLKNTPICDTAFFGMGSTCGTVAPGQAVGEFLAMTGPALSTDTSSTFTTTVTWTAS
jgi:hypothetical protein